MSARVPTAIPRPQVAAGDLPASKGERHCANLRAASRIIRYQALREAKEVLPKEAWLQVCKGVGVDPDKRLPKVTDEMVAEVAADELTRRHVPNRRDRRAYLAAVRRSR